MPDKQYKYRINELLGQLPMADYNKALNALPGQLNISKATFSNYRAIKLGDAQDIPHGVVAQLELFFGIAPGELANYKPEIRTIAELGNQNKETTREAIAKRFGMEK